MFIASQIVGLFALICSLLSFQKKDRSGVMRFQVMASVLFAVQLFMVGAFTGAYLDIASFIRTLFFANRTKKWASSALWLYFFIGVMVVIGVFTYQNPMSIVAVLGAILSTIALWMKEAKFIRLISLFVGSCWIIYNIYYGAYTGAINEVLAMISIIIGIIRHDITRKEDKPENTTE